MGFIEKYRPHVFVAMPYGRREVRAATPQAPAIEADFDRIYERLLKPAITLAGCDAFRADEEPGAGDIRTDMMLELATADFVVADVSTLNANVFYELGIRQGVAERGVLLVHGGWGKPPFDIGPDRRFKYAGALFEAGATEGLEQVKAEVAALATTVRRAMEIDARQKSSPLYFYLEGLRPPDIRTIRSARARYFEASFEKISDRLRVARRKGLVGDILTLANEAPNGLYRSKLLHAAGRSLVDLRRFSLALEPLQEAVALDPDNIDASSFLGLVLNRLGRGDQAEIHVQRLVEKAMTHADAHGALGRIFKDRWRVEWEKEADPAQRKMKAKISAAVARNAIDRYLKAYQLDLRSYYTGVNVLALAQLLLHLGSDPGLPLLFAPERIQQIVETAAEYDLEASRPCEDESQCDAHIWAAATLGELALLRGNAERASSCYLGAATTQGVTHFALGSMSDQLGLYAALDYQAMIVGECQEILRTALDKKPRLMAVAGNVIFASGHMIDSDDRPEERKRFPRKKEGAVAAWIGRILDTWKVGPADVGVCGGARGADLLFAEACLSRGASVLLLVPLLEGEFLERSVDLPGSDWRPRYLQVSNHRRTLVRYQPDELGPPPLKADLFTRNNVWCLNTAWALAEERKRLRVLLVWDGKSKGDGPGGTSHAAAIAREYAGDLKIANPLDL